MIALTELAHFKIRELIASENDIGNLIRVRARELAPRRFDYEIYFIADHEIGEEDVRHVVEELTLVTDPTSTENLEGSTIDFVEGPPGGFKVDNPRSKRVFDDPLAAELNEFIEAEINPTIAAHRGYITLRRIEGSVVYLEMGGSCQGCGMAAMTMRQGVERRIRGRYPQLERFVDVTNHDEGQDPFYAPRD